MTQGPGKKRRMVEIVVKKNKNVVMTFETPVGDTVKGLFDVLVAYTQSDEEKICVMDLDREFRIYPDDIIVGDMCLGIGPVARGG